MTFMRNMTRFEPLFDNADGQGAAGAGAGAGDAAGAAGAGAGAVGDGNKAGAGAGEGARPGAAASGDKAFTYKEDRSDWIPKHRFNEVNTRASRAAELEAAVAERDRKIAALAGVTPPDAGTEKAEKVREAFFGLPGIGARMKKLMDLPDDQFQALMETPGQLTNLNNETQSRWAAHSDRQISTISEHIAEALGVDNLDADQTAEVRVSFARWIKAKAQAEFDSTGDMPSAKRYEAGDPKLLQEFSTAFTKRWAEPARRAAVATNVNRARPIPNSGGRSAVTSVVRPAAFKTLDERLDYAANLARERGVFSR